MKGREREKGGREGGGEGGMREERKEEEIDTHKCLHLGSDINIPKEIMQCADRRRGI